MLATLKLAQCNLMLAGFETFFERSPQLLVNVVQTWRTHCPDTGLGARARRGLSQFGLAACHSKVTSLIHQLCGFSQPLFVQPRFRQLR